MIFIATINTPANTSKSNLLKTILKMPKGLIYQVDFYFPPGSSGLAGVSVLEDNVQLYPRNRNDFFIGDNVTVSFNDVHMFESENNVLDILTYNIDTQYDHQIQVRIGLVTTTAFISSYVPAFSFEKLNTTMENLNSNITQIKEQQAKKTFSLFGNRR